MGLLDTELAKWKRAFGLISGIPKTLKNNPANAATADAMFGLLGGVPGLGDYVSGAEAKYRYDQGDMLGAGLAGLGALPAVPNVAGMFIGKGAKTWDALKAAEAEKLLAKGVDPKEVWKQTGTFKGVDNALRQEIPDNELSLHNVPINKNWEQFFKEKELKEYGRRGAQVSDMKGKSFSAFKKFRENAEKEFNTYNRTHRQMNEIVKHDQLYSAYPELENTGAMWRPDIGKSGEYSRGTVSFGDTSSDEGLKGLFGHELQHAIQQREGWAKGGSPEMFAMPADLRKGMHSYDDMARAEKLLERATREGIPVSSLSPRWADDKVKAIAATYEKQSNGLDSLRKNMEQLSRIEDPNDAYRRLAGEAEARATQARINMDMPQRLENYPLDSYDVPLDQLIVRYDNGVANSKPTGLLSYADEAKKAKNK